MGTGEGFEVEITSDYGELWRYNLAVTCGCFAGSGDSEHDQRLDFIAAEDTVAPVGANLQHRPDNCPSDRTIRFSTVGCDYLLMYVYVIPHTLPAERDISECKPFELQIKVLRGGKLLHNALYDVNCWSGASIELRLPEQRS